MTSNVQHWLDRGRLTLYPGAAVVVFVWVVVYAMLQADIGMDIQKNPLGSDFIQFWSVSHIGLHEHPALAYDMSYLTAVEKGFVPTLDGFLPWRYPPTFYLLVLPFSLLPMWLAWLGFVSITLGMYGAVFSQAIRVGRSDGSGVAVPRALWCLAAFGPIWFNLMAGQTGFLTASLAAGALLCLDRRPVLAGVLIGLLCVKPHLAVLFPLCLIAVGAWRAFCAAAVTVIVFTALSVSVLGMDTLGAFLHGLQEAGQLLETGQSAVRKMPSFFVGLRLLEVPVALAYVAHGVVALLATWAVWRVWRRGGDTRLRNAALMTGSFFISPYVFDYDMVWLAFPAAWLVLYCQEYGWRRFEREALVLCWAGTLFIAPFVKLTGMHVAPFIPGVLLWMIYRRAVTPPVCLSTLVSENPCP